MKPRGINACCERPIKTPQRAWTCFSLFVYLLTGWIWWFIFLPFILFDYRKTSQGKNFKRYRVCFFQSACALSIYVSPMSRMAHGNKETEAELIGGQGGLQLRHSTT